MSRLRMAPPGLSSMGGPFPLLFLVFIATTGFCSCSAEPKKGGLETPSGSSVAVTAAGVRTTMSGGSSSNPAIIELATVQDLAAMQGDLKQLNRLIKELGMTFYLEQSRNMTFFMPTDNAFAALPFNIHELSWQAKWRIMQFHVIPDGVIDLEEELRDRSEKQLGSWEGTPITVAKVIPDEGRTDGAQGEKKREGGKEGKVSTEFMVNKEARVVSKPPKIETFNGAAYKINKVLIPPSMTADDFKPAQQEERINPEVNQRIRRRPGASSEPSLASEQQHASVDGTVQMERSARDPRLPGSFRPDPLANRSQQQPEFVRGVNSQHARWDGPVYHRTPRTQRRDERRPQDELMGFQQQPEEARDAEARIKVLGHIDGAVVPTDGSQPALTRIGGSGRRPSGTIGMTFESSEHPELAPADPITQFMDVLLGGRAATARKSATSQPGSQEASQTASHPSVRQPSNKRNEREPSLFDMEMTPTEAPKVKALGLTEGLLPSEELITQHWAGSSRTQQAGRRPTAAPQQQHQQKQRQGSSSPLAALWQHIQTIP